MAHLTNPFDCGGQWYKANLHTHTTTSDGDASLVDRVEQYRKADYDILAITDHDATNDVEGLSSSDFLVISGVEVHPVCPGRGPDEAYHLICLDVPHGFSVGRDCDANTCVRKAKEAGGEVIYGHPYWCGQNISHILAVEDFLAIEVFNACCAKTAKGYNSVQWDDLLYAGRVVPAVAVDDVHGQRDIFRGWTYIKARELSVKAVMDSLRKGCFYASCGPVIEDFRIAGGKAKVKCSAVKEVHFVGQGRFGGFFEAGEGESLTSAELDLCTDFIKGIKHVRAEVVDQKGRRAWTNPIVL